MIRFLDGPAAGIELSLRRAPVMLRAVKSSRGNWDALDQLDDEPTDREMIHVYCRTSEPTYMHISARGKGGKALRGMWASADYRLFLPQPNDWQMRDRLSWETWCKNLQESPEGQRIMEAFLRFRTDLKEKPNVEPR